MWYVGHVLDAGLYVRVNSFVVCRCAVSRRYITVCNSDVFSVVNMYFDYFKFCVVCINGRRYVCCSDVMVSFMSNKSFLVSMLIDLARLPIIASDGGLRLFNSSPNYYNVQLHILFITLKINVIIIVHHPCKP